VIKNRSHTLFLNVYYLENGIKQKKKINLKNKLAGYLFDI